MAFRYTQPKRVGPYILSLTHTQNKGHMKPKVRWTSNRGIAKGNFLLNPNDMIDLRMTPYTACDTYRRA